MRICDINPYIRYASKADFLPDNTYVYTYDCRLFYIIGSKCALYAAGSKYTLENDTLVMLHSGTRYRFFTDEKITMIVLNFDFTQNNSSISNSVSPVKERKYNKDKVLEHITFSDCTALNSPIILKNAVFAESDLQKIAEEYTTQKILYKEKCSGILKRLIVELARTTSVPPSCASDKIDVIMEFIRNNYQQKIDNETLGRLIGYHPYYLNRLMHAHTGTTFHQYLLNHRLESAKQLLISTDMTVTEIAAECGFATVSYFSNCFKARIGVRPLQFRDARQNLV